MNRYYCKWKVRLLKRRNALTNPMWSTESLYFMVLYSVGICSARPCFCLNVTGSLGRKEKEKQSSSKDKKRSCVGSHSGEVCLSSNIHTTIHNGPCGSVTHLSFPPPFILPDRYTALSRQIIRSTPNIHLPLWS